MIPNTCFSLSVLLICIAFSVGARADDLERMQGRWRLESITSKGVLLPRFAGKHYVIAGRNWLSEGNDRKKIEHLVVLDETKVPKRIFFIDVFYLPDGRLSTNTRMGIYALSNNELKLCMAKTDKELTIELPKVFESKEESLTDLLILKRDTKDR